MLRVVTCGSVDDGKSTLMGRLLYEAQGVFDAEREQALTIDVAYRFFSTGTRTFIVADAPGHEQYTRNMVTGASTAGAAVVLVDARKGVLTQTRRHTYVLSLMGRAARRPRGEQVGSAAIASFGDGHLFRLASLR